MNIIIFLLGSSVRVSSAIDSGISSAVRDSSKLSMAKIINDGTMETTLTAEKDTVFKRNSTDVWLKNVFFRLQV